MGRLGQSSFERLRSFREVLKFLRKRNRLTQAELARAVGYSREQITHLESGRRKPDPTTIAALFVPALNLQEEPELTARLLTLAQAVRKHAPDSDNAPQTGTPVQLEDGAARRAEETENTRVAHYAAAEAAELAQGDLVEAARQYYLARDFKTAADVLLDQGQLLSNQGRAAEAVEVIDQILADLQNQTGVRDRADISRRLLTVRGDLLLNTEQAEQAEADYRQALALASGVVRTTLVYRLAVSLTQRGRAAEALAMAQAAFKDLPPQHRLIYAQLKVVEGGALMALSRLEEAEHANQEALTLADQLALAMPFFAATLRARANNVLGAINAIHRRPAEALAHWKLAVETARLAGLRALEYRCQGNIANVLYEAGDLAGAMAACEAAVEGLRSIGDLYGLVRFLHLRANLLYTQGEIAAALKLAEEACTVKEQLGDLQSLMVSLNLRVKCLFAVGQVQETRPIFDRALADIERLGDDRLQGYWLMLLSELHLLAGEPEQAEDVIRRAMALPAASADPKLGSDCQNHLAMALLAGGATAGASAALDAAAPGAADIPEMAFEHDLIGALLDLARGDTGAMSARAEATAERARERGYLIFVVRASRLLQAASKAPPLHALPALVYGQVIT